MPSLGFLIGFFVLFSTLLIPGHGHLSLPGKHLFSTLLIPGHGHPLPGKHAALFIFGDSCFDAGNNKYINTSILAQANFWPYGETFFNNPTGRFSDGRLLPDFIAEYAKLPLIPTFLPFKKRPFTFGANFASAGAGALVETNQGFVIDLKTQLRYFKIVVKNLKHKLGNPRTKTLISKAVYLFSIGYNDYSDLFISNSRVPESYKKERVAMVIGNITTTIKEIYKKGGRKFGFVSLDPVGCNPFMKAFGTKSNDSSCLKDDDSELATLHNEAFSEALQDLESKLKGFKYAYHDLYSSLYDRIKNPSKYGFKDSSMACCGSGPFRGILSCGGKRGIKEYKLCDNPDEYLYFDFAHYSEKANKQIAELLWSGTADVTGPYNLKTLFELI